MKDIFQCIQYGLITTYTVLGAFLLTRRMKQAYIVFGLVSLAIQIAANPIPTSMNVVDRREIPNVDMKIEAPATVQERGAFGIEGRAIPSIDMEIEAPATVQERGIFDVD